jgi:hypothetical protein
MGVRSTYYIKRETAMQILLMKIPILTDEQLANMLEEFPESDYRNYSIVNEIDEEDEYGYPRAIRKASDF